VTRQYNRREVLAAGAGLALASASGIGRAGPLPERPNILFILADDMGYADLSCYGRTDYRTPNLDRLARDGLLMTSAYANSAVCSASRTALITGRYQDRLQVGLYEPLPGGSEQGIPEGHPTLPGLFRKLGYRTSLIGKWHLGDPPHFGPLQRGYDYFFGFLGGGMDYFRVGGSKGAAALGLAGEAAAAAGMGCELAGAPAPGMPPAGAGQGPAGDTMADGLFENDVRVSVPGYLTDVLADRALRQIEAAAQSRQPFFMSLHFNAPHWPWEGPGDEQASRRISGAYHADGGSIRKYGEMVVALDAAIGRVLQSLAHAGLDRNTLVVFTSDNGGERFSYSWPFTGSKGELLEGGLRIPSLVRWPARIRPGSRSTQPMIHMDWLPTLLAAAGATPDPAWPSDGIDMLPAWLGGKATQARTLFWRYYAAGQAAAREGDWKFLRISGREYLFNTTEDERERANRRAQEPALFARLKAAWETWNATMLPFPAGMPSDNPKSAHCWADHY
jgi:arylsulfatase A-like enzyme